MTAFFFGALGLIVGSFLNVLLARTGIRPLTGRSECLSCGRQLLVRDLIPIVSWLALRGRCRFCKERISVQYPLVELAAAALFVALALAALPPLLLVLSLAIVSLLIAIFFYDLKHMLIPDAWVWSFNALTLFLMLFVGWEPTGMLLYNLYPIIAGPIAALPLFALWLVSRGRWMGLGDVKLVLGFGWLLGVAAGIYAVVLAFLIGALVSVPLLLISKLSPGSPHEEGEGTIGAPSGFTMNGTGDGNDRNSPKRGASKTAVRWTLKSEIPFGPFLIAACLIVWFSMLYQIPLPILWAT